MDSRFLGYFSWNEVIICMIRSLVISYAVTSLIWGEFATLRTRPVTRLTTRYGNSAVVSDGRPEPYPLDSVRMVFAALIQRQSVRC